MITLKQIVCKGCFYENELPDCPKFCPLTFNHVKEWLKQKHKLIQPFTERENDVGYSKEDWHIREIARQVLILELLKEIEE